MKKGAKKTKSPKRPPTADINTDSQNIPPSNLKAQAAPECVQAKPAIVFSGPNLAGTWKTCVQDVVLSQSESSPGFEGSWGVHTLSFEVDGSDIVKAKLGTIDLMFGGSVTNVNTISWGNGQVWNKM
jgi:hypothetical protein